MFKPRLQAAIVLCVLSLGCKMQTSEKNLDTSKNTYKSKNDFITVSITPDTTRVMLDAIGQVEDIIVLDTTESIGNIDKLLIDDDNIFILDRKMFKAFYCFSLSGNLKWKYHNRGTGKDEFLGLTDFHARNGISYLYDAKGRKIISLDRNGGPNKVIGLKNLKTVIPNQLFIDSNQKLVFYDADMSDFNQSPHQIIVVDSMGRKESKHFQKTNNPPVDRWALEYGGIQPFANNNGFYFTRAMADTIYSCQDRTIGKQIYINFAEGKMPESVKRNPAFNLMNFYASNYCGNIDNILENDSLITFRFARGNHLYFSIINKQSNQSRTFLTPTVKIGPVSYPMRLRGMLHNHFIMQFDPVPILDTYNAYRQMKSDMQDAEFDSYLEKIDPTLLKLKNKLGNSLNPVLCIISIQPSKVFN